MIGTTVDARATRRLGRHIKTVQFAQTKIVHNYDQGERPQPRDDTFTVDPRIAARATIATSWIGTANVSASEASDSNLHIVEAPIQANALLSVNTGKCRQASSKLASASPFATSGNTISVSATDSIEIVEIDCAEEQSKPSTAQKYPESKERRQRLKFPDYNTRLSRPAARPVGEHIRPKSTQFQPIEAQRPLRSEPLVAGAKQAEEKAAILPTFTQTLHRTFPLSGSSDPAKKVKIKEVH
ncbi:hypothetical protein ONS95_003887 [Cadophora gregata]|uniref:uncharacterized protein n=1 Tax=Cadophora gregata TaxID=51156 RepID=UPI0026DD0DDC|nr:uncharacterized protein ONS95_003887 [Cadophora gregata]KAK0107182.1 hypothetical protein ONS95_003887 [Cadophora gregata]